MADAKFGIVYIDVDWHRGERTDEPEVEAVWDVDPVERQQFDGADEAIEWARARAPLVLVRLGPSEEECYSAGERHATRELPEEGGTDLRPYPIWPPRDYFAKPT